MAISKKLLKIMGEVRGLSQDAMGFNYRYVSGDKLLKHVRPLLVEAGLMLTTEILSMETEQLKYMIKDKKTNSWVEKLEILYRLKLRMTWIDTEDNEKLEQEWMGAGVNELDKGFGSAITYGSRYFLLKTLLMATDEDDVDAVAAQRSPLLPDNNPAPAPVPQQGRKKAAQRELSPELWMRYVQGEAAGLRVASGRTYREGLIAAFSPDEVALAKFDADVQQYIADCATAAMQAKNTEEAGNAPETNL